MVRRLGALLLGVMLLPIVGCTHQRHTAGSPPATVVFICEHGAAKSVIAAAYFNKLAADRHLNFHAIARGLTPQPDLSTAATAGLNADGIEFLKEKPRRLDPEEAQAAVRVVAFCPLPASSAAGQVQIFDVPAPIEGYRVSRDAILTHVKTLLDQLAAEQSKNGPR